MGSCCRKADPPLPDIIVKFQYHKDILPKDSIYDLACKSAFIGAEAEETPVQCKGILDEERLRLYFEACKSFFQTLNNVNGPMGNREIFYRFMLSGKVWRVHVAHYTSCVENAACSRYANEGLDLWYIVLLTTYKYNIWDPDKSIGRDSRIFKDIISRPASVKLVKLENVHETDQDLLLDDSVAMETFRSSPPRSATIQWKKYNARTKQIGSGSESDDDDDDFNENHEQFLTVETSKPKAKREVLLMG